MANTKSSAGPNVDQLRADIDSGRTGDKVSFPDPAAAPLGTDEEAAGTPLSPEAIALNRGLQSRHAPPRKRPSISTLAYVLAGVTAVGLTAFIVALATG